jgi:hypothetical protein
MDTLEQESNITRGMTPVYGTRAGGGVFNMAVAGNHSLRVAAHQILMKGIAGRDTLKLPAAVPTVPMEAKLSPEDPTDPSDLSGYKGDKKPKAKVTNKKRKATSDITAVKNSPSPGKK